MTIIDVYSDLFCMAVFASILYCVFVFTSKSRKKRLQVIKTAMQNGVPVEISFDNGGKYIVFLIKDELVIGLTPDELGKALIEYIKSDTQETA